MNTPGYCDIPENVRRQITFFLYDYPNLPSVLERRLSVCLKNYWKSFLISLRYPFVVCLFFSRKGFQKLTEREENGR